MNKVTNRCCKKLTIVQYAKNGFLSVGKPPNSFCYDGYHITVEDCCIRNTIIESQTEVEADDLLSVFALLNKLCMICEGSLLNVKKIYIDDTLMSLDELKELLFCSNESDFYGSYLSLISSTTLLSTGLLKKWETLHSEMLLPFNAFLYMTSIKGLPLDIRTAYITECFEPLAYYIEKERPEKISKDNKKNKLFNCLTYIISIFGEEVFCAEKTAIIQDCRIEQIANNRHRLMHLKSDFNGNLLKDGNEMVAYSRKLHLLYRHTLLNFMGVNKDKYLQKLISNVECLDKYMVLNSQNGGADDE